MGVLVIRKTSVFAQYSKAATFQSFSDLAAGWGLPPARTRRVSSIGAGLATPSPRRLFGRRIREQARKSQPLILSVVDIVATKIAVVLVLILILILVS